MEEKRTRNVPSNVVLVSNLKPVMRYVLAILTQFNAGNDTVIVKARGRAISKAVDATEIVKHRYMVGEVDCKQVLLGTDIVKSAEGKEVALSIIEIPLIRIKKNESKKETPPS